MAGQSRRQSRGWRWPRWRRRSPRSRRGRQRGCRRVTLRPRPADTGWFQNRAEAEPQRDRAERKAAENEKHGAVTDLLCDPATERGTERGAEALDGHDRTLPDIDAPTAIEDARDKTGNCDALQSGSDPVENLHRVDPPFVHHAGGDDTADRQR